MRSNQPETRDDAARRPAAPGAAGNGAVLFAQFAYPPNRLGLCGPNDSAAVLEYASAGSMERVRGAHATAASTDWQGLRELARGFDGAWPYLQLIAAANSIQDPLDARVVEAYWIGNQLLSAVRPALLGNSLSGRFRKRVGRQWESLSGALESGARPHHNFHVFCVYPWVGMLNGGRASEPLRILDQCRIRWARVESVAGDQVIATGPVLRWDGRELFLGPDEPQTLTWRHNGYRLTRAPRAGETVAAHWNWLCSPLGDHQLAALKRETLRHLTIANHSVEHLPHDPH